MVTQKFGFQKTCSFSIIILFPIIGLRFWRNPAFGLDVGFVAVANDVAVDGLLVIFEEFSADTAPYLVVSNEKPLFLVVAPNALSRADGHLFFSLKKVHFWPKKGVCSLPHPIPQKKVRFLIKNDLNKFLSFELY